MPVCDKSVPTLFEKQHRYQQSYFIRAMKGCSRSHGCFALLCPSICSIAVTRNCCSVTLLFMENSTGHSYQALDSRHLQLGTLTETCSRLLHLLQGTLSCL